MKKINHKSLILPTLLLAGALGLSACGEITVRDTAGNTSTVQTMSAVSTEPDSGSDNSGNALQSTASETTENKADTIAAVSDVSDSSIYSEAFSERDLSGDYEEEEAVTISLNGSSAEASSDAAQIDGSTVTITAAGTYILSGTLEDGTIVVNAAKDEKVQLVLDGVSISSSDYAAIYVLQADKVFVTLADGTVNTLANGGTFTQKDENEVDAVIFAKDDITLNGTGTLQISSPAGSGIVGKDEVTITEGTYEIIAGVHGIRAKDCIAIADGSFTITASEDGLHAENGDDDTLGSIYIAGGSFVIQVKDDAIHAVTTLQIDGGTFDITAAEGLEATVVRINDGEIQISASDDGVNAAYKSSAGTPLFEMNGGSLTVVMGAGDTDGIDSNGNITINGGTLSVSGQSSFDCDGSVQFNGGTVIVNGQEVNSIPNQMMGGMGARGQMGGGMRR